MEQIFSCQKDYLLPVLIYHGEELYSCHLNIISSFFSDFCMGLFHLDAANSIGSYLGIIRSYSFRWTCIRELLIAEQLIHLQCHHHQSFDL